MAEDEKKVVYNMTEVRQQFSQVVDQLQRGDVITVIHGKRKARRAVIMSPQMYDALTRENADEQD